MILQIHSSTHPHQTNSPHKITVYHRQEQNIPQLLSVLYVLLSSVDQSRLISTKTFKNFPLSISDLQSKLHIHIEDTNGSNRSLSNIPIPQNDNLQSTTLSQTSRTNPPFPANQITDSPTKLSHQASNRRASHHRTVAHRAEPYKTTATEMYSTIKI